MKTTQIVHHRHCRLAAAQAMTSWARKWRAARVVFLIVAALLPGVVASASPLNILWYGNSFLDEPYPTGLPLVVSDIAVAAGQPVPNTVNAAVDAADFAIHLQYNLGVIGSLAPGEHWDYVVMQDYSTAPTHIGNVAQHVQNARLLYEAVAANSPNVVPVMFETWARGPGHEFYTDPIPDFPGGPAQMQAEVRDGYNLSAAEINVAAGSSIARIAPVGDAWQNDGFNPALYQGDLYHDSNLGVLLSSLVLYSTIWNDPTTNDIDLSGILSNLGLTAEDGNSLSIISGLTVVPEPSSLAIGAGGLLGLAILGLKPRRRRRV
jgi:hypothetical protein